MSHGEVAAFLQSLRAQRAAHPEGADFVWPGASWHDALATAAEVPSVRRVALPPMPWSAAGLASLRRVFPHAVSLQLKQLASPEVPRATLSDLLAPFLAAPMPALRAYGFVAASGLPAGVPVFSSPPPAVHLSAAPPLHVERLIA